MSMRKNKSKAQISKGGELKKILEQDLSSFKKAIIFSVLINLISLAPTIYMLEVYDRVLNSRSELTLAMLTIAVIGAYIFAEWLEVIRTQIMQQISKNFDAGLLLRIFEAIHRGILLKIPGVTLRPLSDHRELRNFISSHAMMSLIDAPISLLFLAIIFLIDVRLGAFSLVGVLVQFFLMWINERKVHPSLNSAQEAASISQGQAILNLRSAQVVESMGMQSNVRARWQKKQLEFVERQAVASDYGGLVNAGSKFIQLFQGSALLGLGCWLSVNGHMAGGGGMMIVASVLGGRVLQPMVSLVGSWKMVVDARSAYERLDGLLNVLPAQNATMSLPPPRGYLTIESLIAAAPGSQAAILRGIQFQVPAGQILAVAGPSGSGKSTLAKLLMGIWPASSGKVRLDGYDVHQWNKTELGPFVGYLPQDVELFDGTLAENIARFGEVDMDRVREVSALVGLQEVVDGLSEGYDTMIGEDGAVLSGGQRQRVGIARALYGNPKFIVLDEPNSSLDAQGDAALITALRAMKAKGSTVVVISHRANLIHEADLMLLLVDGTTKAFGPRQQVLAALEEAKQKSLAGSQAGGQA